MTTPTPDQQPPVGLTMDMLVDLCRAAQPPRLGIACRPDHQELVRQAIGQMRETGHQYDIEVIPSESVPPGTALVMNFEALDQLVLKHKAMTLDAAIQRLYESDENPFFKLIANH